MSAADFCKINHFWPLNLLAPAFFKTHFFKKAKGNNQPNGANARPESDDQLDLEEQKKPHALLCVHCRNPITHSRECCSVGGDSEHHCVNPVGILFHIQCFSTAPGCMVLGPATMEETWFSGYSWQMAYCNQCQSHMGWHYSGLGPSFFGLIKNRLIHENLE